MSIIEILHYPLLCLCSLAVDRACKARGVTINSALQAAALQAAAMWILSRTQQKGLHSNLDLGKVTCVTNPQMHKHLPAHTFDADESMLANLMWMFVNEYPLVVTAGDDFWALARRVQKEIASNKQTALDGWPMFAALEKPCFDIFPKLRGKRTGTCNFTNHGECSWVNPDHSSSRVVGLLPLANHRMFGSVFWWFVTTIDRRMFMSVSYVTHAVSEEDVRSHLLHCKTLLLDACVAQ